MNIHLYLYDCVTTSTYFDHEWCLLVEEKRKERKQIGYAQSIFISLHMNERESSMID